MSDRQRVIIALSDTAESTLVSDWVAEAGHVPIRKTGALAAAEEMRVRPFSILIADAALAFGDGLHRLSRDRNVSAPTIVIGDEAAARQCDASGSAMHVARPVDRATLVCLLSMALMDSRPVRQSERKLVRKFEALVNASPAHILDVSNEGVRLEIPRGTLGAVPPYFTVRVPIIGVGVTAQRMWSRPAAPGQGPRDATWCGARLASNTPKAEQRWRSFVANLDSLSTNSLTQMIDVA